MAPVEVVGVRDDSVPGVQEQDVIRQILHVDDFSTLLGDYHVHAVRADVREQHLECAGHAFRVEDAAQLHEEGKSRLEAVEFTPDVVDADAHSGGVDAAVADGAGFGVHHDIRLVLLLYLTKECVK